MGEHQKSFATALNCMDGRAQEPVRLWGVSNLPVQHVDMITLAGVDGSLSDKNLHPVIQDLLRRELFISIEKHGSRHILVVGHCECAGSPVSADEHRQDVARSIAVVRSWDLPEGSEVIGLLVNGDGSWNVEVIS